MADKPNTVTINGIEAEVPQGHPDFENDLSGEPSFAYDFHGLFRLVQLERLLSPDCNLSNAAYWQRCCVALARCWHTDQREKALEDSPDGEPLKKFYYHASQVTAWREIGRRCKS